MAIILLVVSVLATSCKTIERTTDSNKESAIQKNDSVSERVERDVRPVFIPASFASLNLSLSDLNKLPANALYQHKEDQATITITRVDSVFIFKASCDSLTILVEELKTEIYHLNRENTVLKSSLNKQDIEIIKEPTSWQWFQIHGFRVLVIINLIILLWQKRKLLFL